MRTWVASRGVCTSIMGNAYGRGERWLRRSGIPIPLPAHVVAIPHLVPWRFVFGAPVSPRVAAQNANDHIAARCVRREVEGALHEIIEAELAERAGIHGV
ncbi:hypothetical protein LZC95_35545 [Pendulispora brunnea]|uniref:Diacylglycerol O-acyltransferase n=1 Tax=Pendulispora brunnea TaxID=2905690 RepID=A0ABZ2JZ39_9BACT